VRAQFKAPANAAYLVQSIERGAGASLRGAYVFLDNTLATVERREVPDYVFDPRTRGWYQQAVATSHQVKTAAKSKPATKSGATPFVTRIENNPQLLEA
jgi:hypothetical protein